MKLSIIIVNYKTYRLTKQTIDAIEKSQLTFPYEILLVDNASQDGSIEALEVDYRHLIKEEKLKVLCNTDNLGFSKANNRGIRKAKGEYILLLNSDTEVVEDCLESCLAYISALNRIPEEAIVDGEKREENVITEHRKVGALGCKVVLADGSLDHACKRGFPTPTASLYYFLGLQKKNPKKYGMYNAMYLGEDEIGEVDCLTGAFMLMPKAVLDQVGYLDEDFFMYGEDIDLCYRIKEAGYRVMYYPQEKVIHYKGGSSKKRRTKIIYDFHHAMWLFYKKHYIKKYNSLITGLVYIGIQAKYILELAKNALKQA